MPTAPLVFRLLSVDRDRWVLCYNLKNNSVYCANRHGQSVSVIDGVSNQTIATVPVGQRPWALCYDSLRDRVYCANEAPTG